MKAVLVLKIPCVLCKVYEPSSHVPIAHVWEPGIGWICPGCADGVVENGLQALDVTEGIARAMAITRNSRHH